MCHFISFPIAKNTASVENLCSTMFGVCPFFRTCSSTCHKRTIQPNINYSFLGITLVYRTSTISASCQRLHHRTIVLASRRWREKMASFRTWFVNKKVKMCPIVNAEFKSRLCIEISFPHVEEN